MRTVGKGTEGGLHDGEGTRVYRSWESTPEINTFIGWRNLAENLKLVVQTYGGEEAAARIEPLESSWGDAPGIWKKLESWYGGNGTVVEKDDGAEKFAVIGSLFEETYDESKGHPSLFFRYE